MVYFVSWLLLARTNFKRCYIPKRNPFSKKKKILYITTRQRLQIENKPKQLPFISCFAHKYNSRVWNRARRSSGFGFRRCTTTNCRQHDSKRSKIILNTFFLMFGFFFVLYSLGVIYKGVYRKSAQIGGKQTAIKYAPIFHPLKEEYRVKYADC